MQCREEHSHLYKSHKGEHTGNTWPKRQEHQDKQLEEGAVC